MTATTRQKPRQPKRKPRGKAKAAGKGKNATQRQGARSLQDDDAIEGIGARLAASLAGINPVAWARLRQADQAYQRKTMKPALTKLVRLLEDLGKRERERPFRLQGEERLRQSRRYCQQKRIPHRDLPAPEGPTFTELARFFQHHIVDNIPSAPRGPRGELVRDVKHDGIERAIGVEAADRILAPESLKNRKSRLDVLRKARSRRAKKLIVGGHVGHFTVGVQAQLEQELESATNKAWRRNLKEAIAEIRRCRASREEMGRLVVKLTERGFGKRAVVIDLDRYVRALWPEEEPAPVQGK